MKTLDTLRRLAWAMAICVGPLAAVIDIAGARDITRLYDWQVEHAVEVGATWALVAAPLILLLYYCAKYVLTGRITSARSAASPTDPR